MSDFPITFGTSSNLLFKDTQTPFSWATNWVSDLLAPENWTSAVDVCRGGLITRVERKAPRANSLARTTCNPTTADDTIAFSYRQGKSRFPQGDAADTGQGSWEDGGR
ncbi:hypothetical protein LshimejAT787_0110630 [Lyophyllum shimeji]|uniref:Uncharacterized protein n=1 Tax=Lyophyllum shimeji TaxID=47721 RepID=A0A9P3UHK9_LYOSH|nr:hypothetical protein LshimejAT787_0110630 [Lyophyllum shimeji]